MKFKVEARPETTEEGIEFLKAVLLENPKYWATIRRGQYPTEYRVSSLNANDEKVSKIITVGAIWRALSKTLSERLVREDLLTYMLTDNMDEECYDAILQVAMFGELVYA